MTAKQRAKIALISGINGQDGAYLAELLLQKGYIVHGMKRRSSVFNTQRIDHIIDGKNPSYKGRFFFHYSDLTDSSSIIRIVQQVQPDEIYNLAAQSHVQVSFETPEYTGNADGLGTLRFLEAIRILGLEKKTKFYQASTSELFGKVQEIPQTEKTPFYPRSPYGAAKLYAYWITVNYREAYGIYASNGILFNHESPLRGETFVTRKITRAVARISLGLDQSLSVGNLNALRDWGHAKEYVEGMWRILQHKIPDDFVLATNRTVSVRDFIKMSFQHVGIDIAFEGKNAAEIGRCKKTKRVLVKVDPKYFRPTEVELLKGDATKAKNQLKWTPKISVEDLCREMVEADVYRARQELARAKAGEGFVEELVHQKAGFLKWFEKHSGLDREAV